METLKKPENRAQALQIECWTQGRCIESTVLFKTTKSYRARPRNDECLFELRLEKKGYRFHAVNSDLANTLNTQQVYDGNELVQRVIQHLGREWRFHWVQLPDYQVKVGSTLELQSKIAERSLLKKSFREAVAGFGMIVLISGLLNQYEQRKKAENPEYLSPEVARLILKPVKKTELAQRGGGSAGAGPKSAAEMKQTLQSQEIKSAFAQLTSKASLAKTIGNSNQFLSQWKSKSGFKIQQNGLSGASEISGQIGKALAAGMGPGRGIASVGSGGSGYGAGSGSGQGVVGQGSGTVAFETRYAKVEEGLTADEVGEVILRHAAEIRYCYEDALLRNPSTEGNLHLLFKISPRGRVSSTQIKTSNVGDSRLEDCVVRKLTSWAFPQPKGGIEVPVTYPFVFKNLDRGTQAKRQ